MDAASATSAAKANATSSARRLPLCSFTVAGSQSVSSTLVDGRGDLLDVLARARAEVHQLVLFDAVDAPRLRRVRGGDARQSFDFIDGRAETVEAEVGHENHVGVRLRD